MEAANLADFVHSCATSACGIPIMDVCCGEISAASKEGCVVKFTQFLKKILLSFKF